MPDFIDSNLVTTATYSISVSNPFGKRQAEIDAFFSLDYTRVVNDVGVLTLVIPGIYSPDIFVRDGIIEVWRSIGDEAYLETETVWLIRKFSKSRSAEGELLFTIEAVSLNEILHTRLVAYNSNTSYTKKTDNADDIMKAVVRENLGSLALDTARDTSTYLAIDADSGAAPSMTKEFARRYVDEVLKELADSSFVEGTPLYFDVIPVTAPTGYTFRTYTQFRGTDHRSPTSRDPIILGPDSGTIGEYTLTFDYSEEITYAYVGGQGEEDARLIGTYEDATRSESSPFGRRELWVDSQTYSSSTGLTQEAKAAVRNGRYKLSFNGRIINAPGSLYGKDWGWGDFVTVQADGYTFDCRIDVVHITVSNNGEEYVEAWTRSDT